MPEVAVVIATRGRPDALRRSLAAVARAAEGLDAEVVVADDGGDAQAPAAAAGARHVVAPEGPGQGPGVARNAGVRATRAPVLAFTDDDTEVAPDWLRRALDRLEREPGLAGVEGAVVPSVAGPVDAARARVVENRAGGAYLTANLVLRRAAFERAGGFRRLRDDAPARWDVPFREDTDLALRVIARAGPVAFDPALVVRHPVETVSLRAHLRTARFFELDAVFARLHPHVFPPLLTRPLARLRVRSAVAAVLALPLAPRTRAAWLPLAVAVAVQHVQVERDLAAAGMSRGAGRIGVDALRRTPRAALWALVAGAARVYGAVALAGGRVRPRAEVRP